MRAIRSLHYVGAGMVLGILAVGAVSVAEMPDEDVEEAAIASESGEEEAGDDLPAHVVAARTNIQPAPALRPRVSTAPETPLPTAARAQVSLLTSPRDERAGGTSPASSAIAGREAQTRVSTDAGSLFGKSPSATGIGVQRRNPIVSDPRLRGSRVGQLPASGSHWIPARIDLDTMLSKIDSDAIERITAVKGPYSAFYGPNLQFIDFEFFDSPRYAEGYEIHGTTGLDYLANGEQWYGRQTVSGGAADWGYRVGYGHRTGSDYQSGNGQDIAASYHSRAFDVSLGRDFANSTLEFHYLRLDQTDVEFPGQLFDIDYLVTSGYEVEYETRELDWFDAVNVEVWYNRTRFNGNAQSPSKRRQFPLLDFIDYVGFTDVDATSAGYSLSGTWGGDDEPQLTFGTDLRFVKQELNEYSSGRVGFSIFDDANSPIPNSFQANPGLFAEAQAEVLVGWTARLGGRLDYAKADVVADAAEIANLGTGTPQASLAEILGTDEFQQGFYLWSLYATNSYEINPCWSFEVSVGHGQRPPSLTELYVAQSFLFLLQNGQNNATGDPLLRPERLTQCDLALVFDGDYSRAKVNAFYGWVQDHITFENTGVFNGPPAGQPEQVNLQYVNTGLATFTGVDLQAEYDIDEAFTPFATLSYVQATDRTRNGAFATLSGQGGLPREQVPGQPRGAFSGVSGGAEEPLPGISPLESRLGIRWHDTDPAHRWGVELSTRLVAAQRRVATSLLESPTAGFAVWDLRGYWNVKENMLLVAGVENFGDRNYREHLDFRSPSGTSVYQPGANLYGGVTISY